MITPGKLSVKNTLLYILLKNVPANVKQRFKAACAKQGVPMNAKIVELMANWTEAEEEKERKRIQRSVQ